jgi:hypothetical protein
MPRSETAKPNRVAKKAAKKPKPLTMEELVKWAVGRSACFDGIGRASSFKTPALWWEAPLSREDGDPLSNDRRWLAMVLGVDCFACRCCTPHPYVNDAISWPEVEARIIAEVRR